VTARRMKAQKPLNGAAKRLAWLRGFLEMCEAGDSIVGATPQSLALRVDLKRQIADIEAGAAGSSGAFLACSKPGERGGGTSPAISREAGNRGYPRAARRAPSINGQDGAEAGK